MWGIAGMMMMKRVAKRKVALKEVRKEAVGGDEGSEALQEWQSANRNVCRCTAMQMGSF